MITKVREVKLKRAMRHQGSSLDIIYLPFLGAIGVHRDNIMRQPQGVTVGGNCTYTLGFANLDLIVGLIRAMLKFHVIDS